MTCLMRLCWHVAIVCSGPLPLLAADKLPGLLVRLIAPVHGFTMHSKASAVLLHTINSYHAMSSAPLLVYEWNTNSSVFGPAYTTLCATGMLRLSLSAE